jgi:hypothetical protein
MIMKRSSRPQTEDPGQDSFLDIVANLVGILIILIIVIGARATDAMISVDHGPATADVEPQIDVQGARTAADAVERDIHQIESRIQRQDLEVAYRRAERDRIMLVVGALEEQLESRRAALDTDQQAHLAAIGQLVAVGQELEDLRASRQALESSVPPKNVIEHLPTPMAQTVFGREIHFCLRAGRVSYVPWDELVARLKEDAPKQVWKLRDTSTITETMPPVRGYRMKYTLRHADQARPGGNGTGAQRQIELDRFVLLPIEEGLGEPLALALSDSSEFRAILASLEPSRTTVTVWVYPDSFDAFRKLKAELFQRGYATAGRPLPEGHPIGGSPDGSRSASQ